MDKQDQDEILSALREELQDFFSWLVEELGEEYFIGDKDHASQSLDKEAEEIVSQRARSERVRVWERDRYAFFHHTEHPSVYKLLEAGDLEIFHYPEELPCEHLKVLNISEEMAKPHREGERRYDQPFGVLLASQTLGWMYRLDFCDLCGLVEIWSMEYNPSEVALYVDGG